MKNPVLGLLQSRKFLVLLLALIATIALDGFGVEPEVWAAIDAVAVALIGAIAYEDAAEKRGGAA